MITKKLLLRIEQAIFMPLCVQDWLYSLILLFSFTLISIPIGLYFKFLKLQIFQESLLKVVYVLIYSVFSPAITEELFFRVLLLPHMNEKATESEKWLWGFISLVIFIIYHPLEGITVFPAGLTTFVNPVFLLLTTLLGILCTILYFQTGSIWIPVVVHWFIVIVWLLLLGGYDRLKPNK
ncbi:MAG: CPBP family intramembrane metalloprotease [Dolichospermum sp. BR01]|nr:CPBP family intramembrane metalloprotease [Dolichospermum sp. BR01]